MTDATISQALPGSTVYRIFYNKEELRFETNHGSFTYGVYGDCCSISEFWDFYGVKNLIGSKVLSVESVELDPATGFRRQSERDISTQYYGYKIVSENKEWGEVTAVFSFRNVSNGYYGGILIDTRDDVVLPEINDDIMEASDYQKTL